MRPCDARLGGSILFVLPISPGSLDVGKSRPLVGVIPLLRGFRTTRSTSTVVAPTSLDRRKPRQPLQLVALRACSEPCRHVPIELWIPGKHSDWHHQRASQPRNDSVVPGRPCSSRRSVSREMPARAASSAWVRPAPSRRPTRPGKKCVGRRGGRRFEVLDALSVGSHSNRRACVINSAAAGSPPETLARVVRL